MLMRNSSLVHVIAIYNIFFQRFFAQKHQGLHFFLLLREANNLFGDKFVFYPLFKKTCS